jgi:short-subunit dehydrogenase
MDISGKVAIITGASMGIGEALAKELGARGAAVVLAARSAQKLAELEAQIPGSFAVVTDMRKQGDIANLINAARSKFGRIDILINNAGQGLHAPVEQIDMGAYRSIMELNVFSVLEAMQAVLPVMRAQGGGLILNVSSMVSKNYFPGLAAYASTKYALNALTLTARQELAPDNIAVCAFHPKMTATSFGMNSAGEKYDSAAPRRGMGIDTPEDVAKRIAEQIESEEAEANM